MLLTVIEGHFAVIIGCLGHLRCPCHLWHCWPHRGGLWLTATGVYQDITQRTSKSCDSWVLGGLCSVLLPTSACPLQCATNPASRLCKFGSVVLSAVSVVWSVPHILIISLALYRQQGQVAEDQGSAVELQSLTTLLRVQLALASRPRASQTSTSRALW